MALVVLLRGVSVGGHRTLRPATLAEQLTHLGAVNIGAAGTFVIRRPVSRAHVRAELAGRLPFDTEIVIIGGREAAGLRSRHHFADQPERPDIVRFVSVLSRRPRATPSLPMSLPSTGTWLLRILARESRFVFGVYRRRMKAIGYLGKIDQVFAVPATTRNWNTITAIARVLDSDAVDRSGSSQGTTQRHSSHSIPEGTAMPDLATVFEELRAILAPFAPKLDVKADSTSELSLDTRHLQKNKRPLFFGAVQMKKNYVSFHLMPVYVEPRLLESISPALRKRMQGKSCFNFTEVDKPLFKELATLTKTGFRSYKDQGFV